MKGKCKHNKEGMCELNMFQCVGNEICYEKIGDYGEEE